MKYYHRGIEPKLKELAQAYPVIVISGPRQSGKSTLVKNVFSEHEFVSLEDLDEREFAQNDPRGFLSQFKDCGVIIDEIQNVPHLFSYIQGIVDDNNRPGSFILTGSAQLDLMEKVTQSLAGRSGVFKLLPFSKEELDSASRSHTLEESLFMGSYPRVHLQKLPAADWYMDYCQTYLERDVRKVINLKDLGTFQLFLKMCAARCGQILNYTSLANDCGISPNTAKEWINILEGTFIVYRLRPYYKNYSKRLIKSPKLYFHDTGVACSLLGVGSERDIVAHSMRGALFENWILNEYQKEFFNKHRSPSLYYWRDNKGKEIDLIIERPRGIIAAEMKSGKTVNSSFFDNLKYFQTLAKEELLASLLYFGGEKGQKRSDFPVFSWKEINKSFDLL